MNQIHLISFLLFALYPVYSASIPEKGMLCEFLQGNNDAQITDNKPEFSWVIDSEDKDETQSAYQILVASSQQNLDAGNGDMWNSGWINSSQSINIEYNGSPLASGTGYYWKVRVKTDKGDESEYSPAAQFNTGNLSGSYTTDRYRLVVEDVPPQEVIRVGDGHYFIDFGKAAFGTIAFSVNNSSNGTVDVRLGEKRSGNSVNRSPGGTIRYQSTSVQLNDNTTDYQARVSWRPLYDGWVGMPNYVFEVAPFRYAELIGIPQLDTSSIRQKAVFYPFDWDASSFSSSNRILNDVWDLCKYSMKATSFIGIYVDGDRERKPYEGDAYIQQLSHYSVDPGAYSIARYSHEYLMDNPTWPTEWKQHSVMMAWQDFMYTGNLESLKSTYNALKSQKTLENFARSDGLIQKNPNMTNITDLVDWPEGERDGHQFANVNTVINAFYYHCLSIMAKMAEALGNNSDANRYSSEAQKVYEVFNQKLWNASNGVYIDGEGRNHSSLHANMFSLAFGLVPADRVGSVVAFIKSRGMACSVYGAQYLLEALYTAGEDTYALELMTAENKRSWQNMINVGSTITLEAWDRDYKDNLDWNHAWGAAPGNIIPRHMFGIQPLEPGFGKFQIKPQTGNLTEVSITTPTIRGQISVDITQKPTRYDVIISVPANTTADVYIPNMGFEGTDLIVDRVLTNAEEAGDFLVLKNMGSGTRHIIRSDGSDPSLSVHPEKMYPEGRFRFMTVDGRMIYNGPGSINRVQIFNLRGIPVLEIPVTNNELIFNGRLKNGAILSRGVYLTRLTGKGIEIVRSFVW